MTRRIDENRMAEAIREYVGNDNVSLRHLSKKYGYSYETIRNRIGKKFMRPRGGKKNDVIKSVSAASLGHRKLIKLPSEQLYNNNSAWTPKDDDLLRDALRSGYTSKELSEISGRSISSIHCRKCVLVAEGFIPKGLRFVAPKGLLRKKFKKNRVVDPVRAESDRLLQKYSAISKMVPPFVPIVKEKPAVQEKKSVRIVELEGSADIHAIKLEDLAAIVNKHGISVSISVLKTGTEIRITK